MWHVVYTKPRSEKKVYQRFLDAGFESYCPTQKIKKQWTDRIKTTEVPLFTSYVFVKANAEQNIQQARFITGVVNFVYWLGKPAAIRDKDFEQIQLFLTDEAIQSNSIELNQTIEIKAGAFKNNVGVIKKLLKNKAILYIEALGLNITVSLKAQIK
jgi:transcription antitermination factor NusG